MKLYICDDQKSELEHIGQIVSEYRREHTELPLFVQCFPEPFAMLDEINKNGAPDIALLDICMPGILGTELAQEIQSKSEGSTDIIFLTVSTEFAVEAFALHASDYLTKPYTAERLTDTLDRVMERRRKRRYAPIQCGREYYRIDLYTILYAESVNHNVEIHLTTGKCLKTRTSLTSMKELLEETGGFAAVGASYIVNLRCVQKLLPAALEMTDGDVIPVPRRQRVSLKKQYFDFYEKEATGV